MTYYPMIGIVTADHADVASQVFSALPEWGPGTFGIALAPTSEGPATHMAFGNGSSTQDDANTVMSMKAGVLPAQNPWGDPIVWGEDGWPSEADALEAVTAPNFDFRVYGGGDGLTPAERFANWLTELSLVRVE